MSDPITDLSAISQVHHTNDLFEVVDVSDPTMDATGTNKSATPDFIKYAVMGAIQGLEMEFNSTTVLRIKAGTIGINGKKLTLAQTDYTSGTTLKKMDDTAYTLANSKCVHVYAYDNAGTLEIRTQEWASSADEPTFDTALDYWKHPTSGVVARRIGKFFTNGSGAIIKFWMKNKGRSRYFRLAANTINLVSAGASSSYASVTITPYMTSDDSTHFLRMTAGVTTGTNVQANTILSIDAGTTDNATIQGTASTSISIAGGEVQFPYTGTLHYKTSAANGISTVNLHGFTQEV